MQTLCINKTARATLKRWLTFKKVEAIPPPPKDLPVKKAVPKEDVDKLVKNVVEDVKK